MLARNPLFNANTVPSYLPFVPACGPVLAAQLDTVLATLPAVRATGLDPVVEALLRPLRLPSIDVVCRRVRLHCGTLLTVVVVPAGLRCRPGMLAGLCSLKRAARALGRRVLLVPAGALAHSSLWSGECR